VVSCINLVIAVGLCVDYSAHIAHCFMGQIGGSDERAIKTLRDIGPAVLNGGFSTFLAFILTAGSTSHVFSTFFKVFFLVALFGLYHALVFLPVVLSVFGNFMKSPNSETIHEPENNVTDEKPVHNGPHPNAMFEGPGQNITDEGAVHNVVGDELAQGLPKNHEHKQLDNQGIHNQSFVGDIQPRN